MSVEEQGGMVTRYGEHGGMLTRRHRQSVHIVPGHGHPIVRAEQTIDNVRADTAPLNTHLHGNHTFIINEYLRKLKMLQRQSVMMRKIL